MNVYRVAWVAKPGEMYRITHLYADSPQDAVNRLRSAYTVYSVIDVFHMVKKLDWK